MKARPRLTNNIAKRLVFLAFDSVSAILAPVILDSKMKLEKTERGNLILETGKTCPKS